MQADMRTTRKKGKQSKKNELYLEITLSTPHILEIFIWVYV